MSVGNACRVSTPCIRSYRHYVVYFDGSSVSVWASDVIFFFFLNNVPYLFVEVELSDQVETSARMFY